ncbi:hypothetical protein EJ02DRAFT_306337, partial [Clathrospora elynae]
LRIDAICIDQESKTEKNNQVQQMGNIFGRARSTIAWMGENKSIDHFLEHVRRRYD